MELDYWNISKCLRLMGAVVKMGIIAPRWSLCRFVILECMAFAIGCIYLGMDYGTTTIGGGRYTMFYREHLHAPIAEVYCITAPHARYGSDNTSTLMPAMKPLLV